MWVRFPPLLPKINISMIDQEKINAVIGNRYASGVQARAERLKRFQEFKYSGPALIKKINPGEKVLDVGCGDNFLKHLYKLDSVGIDPVSDYADVKDSLQNYNTKDKYDVILALGSIQDGELEDIKSSIAKLCELLKPNGRIYWRSTTVPIEDSVNFFNWSIELHQQLSKEFGFELIEVQVEPLSTSAPRIYAEWVRNTTDHFG